MLASGSRTVDPGVGNIALAAFPAIILGGLDSPLGAVIGGVVIGLTQQWTAGYLVQEAQLARRRTSRASCRTS